MGTLVQAIYWGMLSEETGEGSWVGKRKMLGEI